MMIKAIKVIRDNWKKSLFFSGLTLWGSNYLLYKLKCYNMMRAFCEEAQRYGQDKLDSFHQPRHITVILNPVACNKKGKLKYEKYAAPLFHLAGLRVSLIQTEREGQAKDLMEIMDNTDAVVIAGGNGTVHEAVTGLLRRNDQEIVSQKLPIGLIPIGKRNTIFKRFNQQDDGLEVKLAESAMAVIRETIKQIDVMKIEGKQQGKGKPVFSLNGLDYGNFRDSLSRVDKYWWFGSLLKPYLALIMNPQGFSKNLNITYSLPCDGCNKCYSKFIPTISQNEPKRWWQMFLSRREITDPSKVIIDYYKNIDNPDCGKWIDIGSVNTANLFIKNTNQHKIQLNILPEKLSPWEYIKTGVEFYNSQMNNQQLEDEIVKKIEANDVRIQLNDGNDEQDNHDENDNKNEWFSIDTESYEAQSIQVNLLPKKLKIYSN